MSYWNCTNNELFNACTYIGLNMLFYNVNETVENRSHVRKYLIGLSVSFATTFWGWKTTFLDILGVEDNIS